MIPEVQPDLVLMDVMMPEMDGFEVCGRLREKPETKNIPVIFLTAKTEKEDVVKGLEAGGVDYITKPFNKAELLARVKTHLELTFARQELKELNTTKDKFLSIIAHDLKNPLQILMLSADILHAGYDSFDEDKRKDHILKFLINSRRISELVENLLDWARSQGGGMECKPRRTDIAVLVDENMDLLKESAQKKNIAVTSKIKEGTFVFADGNMMRTVIRNLLSNAVKFTHPGGTVTVTASEKNKNLEIRVTDTGVGIQAEDIPGLFRIDVRKTAKGTAQERGTGLGLILCKEFVEINNGSITVSSTPGKGSTFTVILPISH
jgi:signal transduction histidine kinase